MNMSDSTLTTGTGATKTEVAKPHIDMQNRAKLLSKSARQERRSSRLPDTPESITDSPKSSLLKLEQSNSSIPPNAESNKVIIHARQESLEFNPSENDYEVLKMNTKFNSQLRFKEGESFPAATKKKLKRVTFGDYQDKSTKLVVPQRGPSLSPSLSDSQLVIPSSPFNLNPLTVDTGIDLGSLADLYPESPEPANIGPAADQDKSSHPESIFAHNNTVIRKKKKGYLDDSPIECGDFSANLKELTPGFVPNRVPHSITITKDKSSVSIQTEESDDFVPIEEYEDIYMKFTNLEMQQTALLKENKKQARLIEGLTKENSTLKTESQGYKKESLEKIRKLENQIKILETVVNTFKAQVEILEQELE